MDLHQGAAAVVLAAEQELGFEPVEGVAEGGQALVDLRDDGVVVLLGGELAEDAEVLARRIGLGDGIEPALELARPSVDGIGGLAVVPEFGFGLTGLELVEFRLQRGEVKDPP